MSHLDATLLEVPELFLHTLSLVWKDAARCLGSSNVRMLDSCSCATARQRGLFTLAQALAAGFDRDRVRFELAVGAWQEVAPRGRIGLVRPPP